MSSVITPDWELPRWQSSPGAGLTDSDTLAVMLSGFGILLICRANVKVVVDEVEQMTQMIQEESSEVDFYRNIDNVYNIIGVEPIEMEFATNYCRWLMRVVPVTLSIGLLFSENNLPWIWACDSHRPLTRQWPDQPQSVYFPSKSKAKKLPKARFWSVIIWL